MSEYWKNYWNQHAESVEFLSPLEQVLRVKNKKAQSEESFKNTLQHIRNNLDLHDECVVLDLCCGNGLITNEMAGWAESVFGVDFCEELINLMNKTKPQNVSCLVSDVDKLKFESCRFDRVLCAAALQHFSLKQVVVLFEKIFYWLKPEGTILITDVLDLAKQWEFYNDVERENVYFEHLKIDKPILGTWFDTQWLKKVGRYVGFTSVEIITQPSALIYSHYRVDVKCKK